MGSLHIIPDMINPQKGIDLMNNTSIINRILFAVTIFQHSPLTRRVFYNNIRRERGQHHQHLRTLTGISINHWKFFSSSTSSFTINELRTDIIILINMRLIIIVNFNKEITSSSSSARS
jgi:hypothetical protein